MRVSRRDRGLVRHEQILSWHPGEVVPGPVLVGAIFATLGERAAHEARCGTGLECSREF